MRVAARSVLIVVASTAPWMAACLGAGDDFAGLPPPDGGEASMGDGAGGSPAEGGTGEGGGATDGRATDGGSADGGDATITTTSTMVGIRLANWAHGAASVDFCLAPHGTGAFQGPILAAATGDAGVDTMAGLSFPSVSAYTLMLPGAYDVRIVPGALGTDCSPHALVPDLTKVGPLAAGATATLALVGDALTTLGADSGVQLKVVPFLDDPFGPPPKIVADTGAVVPRAGVRFINAAPGLGAVDVRATDTVNTTKVFSFTGIPFGTWKDGGTDTNGYQLVTPFSKVPVDVRLSGLDAAVPDLVPPPKLSAAVGATVTMALTGMAAPDGPLLLVECIDDAASVTPYSPCYALSVSTCGDGIKQAFEECDCGARMGIVETDEQCIAAGLSGSQNGEYDPNTPWICSPTCHLN
jgi:hypothetical protein